MESGPGICPTDETQAFYLFSYSIYFYFFDNLNFDSQYQLSS